MVHKHIQYFLISFLPIQRQAAAQGSPGTVKTEEIHYGQIDFSKWTPGQTSSQTSRGQQSTLSAQETVYAQVRIKPSHAHWGRRAEKQLSIWPPIQSAKGESSHLQSSKDNVNKQRVKCKRMWKYHVVLANDTVVFILLTFLLMSFVKLSNGSSFASFIFSFNRWGKKKVLRQFYSFTTLHLRSTVRCIDSFAGGQRFCSPERHLARGSAPCGSREPSH